MKILKLNQLVADINQPRQEFENEEIYRFHKNLSKLI
jgi:hypothetical protein